MFEGLAKLFRDTGYRGCGLMNTAAEWRGSDSGAGRLARSHVDRIRGVLAGLSEEAGFADPAALGDQLLLLLEGAMALRMMAVAADPAGDARRAAAALLAGQPRR
jgi:hypothetical protein